ncbi:MAG: hypothetical protein KKA84_12015 [Bacteroidetes bacterium]|nr:hypothetical protein [Bacteroidota bacterium]
MITTRAILNSNEYTILRPYPADYNKGKRDFRQTLDLVSKHGHWNKGALWLPNTAEVRELLIKLDICLN